MCGMVIDKTNNSHREVDRPPKVLLKYKVLDKDGNEIEVSEKPASRTLAISDADRSKDRSDDRSTDHSTDSLLATAATGDRERPPKNRSVKTRGVNSPSDGSVETMSVEQPCSERGVKGAGVVGEERELPEGGVISADRKESDLELGGQLEASGSLRLHRCAFDIMDS